MQTNESFQMDQNTHTHTHTHTHTSYCFHRCFQCKSCNGQLENNNFPSSQIPPQFSNGRCQPPVYDLNKRNRVALTSTSLPQREGCIRTSYLQRHKCATWYPFFHNLGPFINIFSSYLIIVQIVLLVREKCGSTGRKPNIPFTIRPLSLAERK